MSDRTTYALVALIVLNSVVWNLAVFGPLLSRALA